VTDKPKPSLKVEQRKAPDCRFVVDLFVTHGWSVGNALEVLAS